jgi:predicted MFS family arabinose efflux permease
MDNLGRRPVLLISGLGNVLALATMTLLSDIGVALVVVFVIHRVLQIAIFTAMLTLSADVLPRERMTQGLAILGLGGLLPMATGGAIGDVILNRSGFTSLFLVAAALSMASWLVVWMIPTQPTASGGGLPRRGFWAALGQRNLLPVWWLTLLFALGLEALFTFIRTYVDEQGIGSVGFLFLTYGGAAIVVRIASSAGLDRLPQLPLIVVSVAAFALGLVSLGLAASDLEMGGAAVLLGAGHGLLFPVLTALVVTRARDAERGSAMAVFTSLFDLAILIAAPVTGAIIDWRGYSAAFASLGVFVAVGLVGYVVWDRTLIEEEPQSIPAI